MSIYFHTWCSVGIECKSYCKSLKIWKLIVCRLSYMDIKFLNRDKFICFVSLMCIFNTSLILENVVVLCPWKKLLLLNSSRMDGKSVTHIREWPESHNFVTHCYAFMQWAIKWRRLGWMGRVACLEKTRNACRILIRNLDGSDYFLNLGINGKLILDWMLKKRVWGCG